MSAAIHFSITSEPINAALLAEKLDTPLAGAVVTFDGRVRNHNAGREVTALEYQAYAALAISTGQRILEEEAVKHDVLAVSAAHRTGALAIGDVAVWVGVASAHRAAAFDAARSIMERLKYELPIWKKETYADGQTEWVGPDQRSAVTGLNEEIPEWKAKLLEIWISDGNDFRGRHGQQPMQHETRSVEEVECVAGMGLRGDRYFGYKPDFKGQITFFNAEAVEAVRAEFSQPELSSAVFRRNVIVKGVDFESWVGKRFRFQGVEFEASEECKPCYWMDEVVGAGAEEFLKANFRGGLRARILTDGLLRVDQA